MKSRANWFNLIFIVIALALAGCETDKPKADQKQKVAERALQKKYKKEQTLIQLFLEAPPNAGGLAVPVLRENPVTFNIQTNAFLDSQNIVDASLVDYMDGFGIEIKFDEHGTFVLDTVTTSSKRRHILVQAQSRGQTNEVRWLAAPVINQRISTGIFAFTPDATREEAEKMVWGIKNLKISMGRRGQL